MTFFRIVILLVLLVPGWARADAVVIVHPQSDVSTLSKRELINIFMGRYRFFPSGRVATPLDLPRQDSKRISFYLGLTGRNAADLDAYWARLVLTGAAARPQELSNEEAVLERVAHDPSAIGYVSRTKVDKRVRIIFDPAH